MIPICDYSTNINLYDGITGETISYYGNQYNDFPTTGYYVAGSYPYAGVTRSDGVFVPMVSLFNGRRSILIEGILDYDPYFTMDFQ